MCYNGILNNIINKTLVCWTKFSNSSCQQCRHSLSCSIDFSSISENEWKTCSTFRNCQNPNLTSTQQQFNQSWVWHENDVAHPPNPQHKLNVLISLLLLTQFLPNFKHMFLGPSWTVFNCHSNICLGNICPYQEYLRCYWPNFDKTLKVSSWDYLEQI